jgi:hypothetical protein
MKLRLLPLCACLAAPAGAQTNLNVEIKGPDGIHAEARAEARAEVQPGQPGGRFHAAGTTQSQSVTVTSDGQTTVKKTTTTRDGVTETVIETTGPDGVTTVTRDGAFKNKRGDAAADAADPAEGVEDPDEPRVATTAFAGLRVQEAPEVLRDQLGLAENEGLVVDLVAPDGPAATAGITTNDILLKLDGQPLASPADLRHGIRRHAPGDMVEFSLLRKGRNESATVTLGESEANEETDGPAGILGDPADLARRIMEGLNLGEADFGGLGDFQGMEIVPDVQIEIRGGDNGGLDALLDDPNLPESFKALLRKARAAQEKHQEPGKEPAAD